MTRKPPVEPKKPVVRGPGHGIRFVAGTSLLSARKQAERDKAVAIARVKIVKREPIVRGGPPFILASCSVYLPTTSKVSRRATWKVKKAQLLPPKLGMYGVSPYATDRPGDPFDFRLMRSELTQLSHDALVEVAKPTLRNEPKARNRLEVTITNHSPYGIIRCDVLMLIKGAFYGFSYSGDPLPPGRNTVVTHVDDVELEDKATPEERAGYRGPRPHNVFFVETAPEK